MPTDPVVRKLHVLSALFDGLMSLMPTQEFRIAVIRQLCDDTGIDVFDFLVGVEETLAEHDVEGAWNPEQIKMARLRAREQWLAFKGDRGEN